MQNLLIGRATEHAFVRLVALALTTENLTRSLSAVIMMTSVGKTFLTNRDECIERLPKDLGPIVAAFTGRHLNIKDHVAKWPLRRRRRRSPFCCRMIYRNGAADYGDPIWQ